MNIYEVLPSCAHYSHRAAKIWLMDSLCMCARFKAFEPCLDCETRVENIQ